MSWMLLDTHDTGSQRPRNVPHAAHWCPGHTPNAGFSVLLSFVYRRCCYTGNIPSRVFISIILFYWLYIVATNAASDMPHDCDHGLSQSATGAREGHREHLL